MGPLSDALKAPYIAAATYGYAALALQTVLSSGVGAIGWLVWSVIMLNSRVFSAWMGVLGIIANVIGIVRIGCSYRSGVFRPWPLPIPSYPAHRHLVDCDRHPAVSLW